MDKLETLIWLEGLKNAIKFKGKAQPGAIMGKIMKDMPEYRSQSQMVKNLVDKIIGEVNTLSLEEQTKKVLEMDPHALDKVEHSSEKKILPDLPNALKGKVVMRAAPFPSGALHIGNARMLVLNDEYVKLYDGKLLLVFDDTIGTTKTGMEEDPEGSKFVIPEAYDLIRDGLKWLGVKYHEEYYKSDRVEIYQSEAEKLIQKAQAYVCTCPADEFREKYKKTGIECPCRNKPLEHHLDLYDKMKGGGIAEGAAVVRLKTGMDQKDPAIRDHIIMRISDAPHPRIGSKVRLWPTLEFSWGLDDHLLGITHIIRGIDLKKEGDIEHFMWKMYGWTEPEIMLYGRLDFGDEFKLSKTFQRTQIQAGKYEGWSDPRTWSMQSLDIRGIRPEALRETLIELGMSNRNITFDKSWVYAKNKKLIDADANRYWFVENAKVLNVQKIPFETFTAKPLLHPLIPEKGHREVPITIKEGKSSFYIAEDDLRPALNSKGGIVFNAPKVGDCIRIKDMFNIKITALGDSIQADYYSQEKEAEIRKIQVVPIDSNIPVRVLQPNGVETKGYAESNLKSLLPKSIVQFERYGYVRLIKSSKKEIYGYYINE